MVHDAAWAGAVAIMDCFDGVLLEEEKRDASEEIYQRVRAAIDAYALMAEREAKRLGPSRN